jgi:hypothetical protein
MAAEPDWFLEVAGAFAADRVDSWPDPDRSLWRFWRFEVIVDGDECVTLGRDSMYSSRSDQYRYGLAGLLDRMSRSQIDVGYWRLGVAANSFRGRLATAAVFICSVRFAHTAWGLLPWIGVRRDTDPAGWPLAVGTLYSCEVGPLLDHMLESPLYEADHDRIAAAIKESLCLSR